MQHQSSFGPLVRIVLHKTEESLPFGGAPLQSLLCSDFQSGWLLSLEQQRWWHKILHAKVT